MSSEENGLIAGIGQAKADANLQYGISLLHPFLVKLILSNPITRKKLGDKKPDFSQSLQAIIEDWSLFYPAKSKFAAFQTYFSRAKQVRHWVAHQSFDRNRYQHCMECLANVATAVGQPKLTEIILNLVVVKYEGKEKQDQKMSKKEKNQMNVTSLKEDEWTSFRLSKFDLAREDIEDAIQLNPKNVKYFRVLSEVLLEMKLYRESLAACLQGLELNPRDEVLNVRERDCRALMVYDITWFKSDKSTLGETEGEKSERREKELNRIKTLPLTSEDIEDCPNVDKWRKIVQISKSVDDALKLEHGSSSIPRIQEEKAFKMFESAAKKGSADGLYYLSTFYCEGKAGLPRDFYKAYKLCRKAARQKAFIRFQDLLIPNQGVAEAELFLGDCYRDGRGVDRCSTEAFQWYLKSSRHNSSNGQASLGVALLYGDGCKKNATSARSWLQQAAERGHAASQYIYGMMLEEGLGGPIDVKKAAELLQLSANQGVPGALMRLQNLSMSGAIGASNMQRTNENLKEAAEKGDAESLFLLAQNYLSGAGRFEKDLCQAEKYLREASKANYANALLPLGKLLLELKKNEEAIEFIKLAAEKGSAEGQYELGILFAYGHGCARDEGKARRWLNRAKQQGFSLQLNSQDGDEKSTDDWVEKSLDLGRDTTEFETQQQLSPEGMSISERKTRFATSTLDPNDPLTSAYLECLAGFRPGRRRPLTPDCMNELVSRAKNGSTTAKSFFNAREMVVKAMDLLKQKQTNDAFKLFRLSIREWESPISEYADFYYDCIKAATEALDRNSEDAEALYVLALFATNDSNEEKLRKAKRCVELDPSVPDFHHLFSSMLGSTGAFQNGLRAIDRALELLPNHLDWLLVKATWIRLLEQQVKKLDEIDSAEVVEAYLKFISSNPTADHRDFPQVCYSLALIYALSSDKTNAKTYYQKGLDAEDPRVRLPCFEPVQDDLPAKKMTRVLLNTWEGIKLPHSNKFFTFIQYFFFFSGEAANAISTALKQSTNNCANCFKSNQSFRCNTCKGVWYCNRACQIAHWKKHKVDCKPLNCP